MVNELIRKYFKRKQPVLTTYDRAMGWINRHVIPGQGIAVTDRQKIPYPEVAGYFIPTLLQWGERELARQFGRWLVSIQNPDGSWSDPAGIGPYTFDTGQILKGLVALSSIEAEYEPTVRRGCEWLLNQVQPDGRVTTPDTSQWLLLSGKVVPEAIHLYALEPLVVAGKKWGVSSYIDAVDRALAYYLSQPDVTRFETLSHFHAYIIEALIDLGQRERASAAMAEIASLQSRSGAIPGYSDTSWVCSTGLFQYAVIWYRLGERERASRAFTYACSLQNGSGGFFGSYGWHANYFSKEEISWAIKYFLDALQWKITSSFDQEAANFPDSIDGDDGRYHLVSRAVREGKPKSALEAGCGKGRFLRHLQNDFPEVSLAGVDLSERMLSSLPAGVQQLHGSLLNLPVADGQFDLVYCIEALEHAVNIPGALKELSRAVAPGGVLIIVDKNRDCLGKLQLSEWEQWFEKDAVADVLRAEGFDVSFETNIPYDKNSGSDGLFLCWKAQRI